MELHNCKEKPLCSMCIESSVKEIINTRPSSDTNYDCISI